MVYADAPDPHSTILQSGEKPSSAHQEAVEDVEDTQSFRWSFDVISNVLSLCLFIFTNSWVQLVPTSAIAFIAARFPSESHNSAWIATASTIVPAVVSVFIGDISDIFGRRAFLLVGSAVGFVGMLVAGRANSLMMLIGGQVLNGLGMGCGYLAIPLVQEIVPKKQRPVVTALTTLISSGSFIGAPIIEGVLIDRGYGGPLDGWRVGFYIGAAFYGLTGAAIITFYHPMPRPNPEGLATLRRLARVDWLGIFLATAGVTLFLVGLNTGGNPEPWTDGLVLGPLIPGGICLLFFALWEWKGTTTGILPHAIFADRNYSITLVIRLVGGIALFGGQAFLPQVLVYVFGTDGIDTAVQQLPFSISTIFGAFLAAGLIRWLKEAKWIVVTVIMVMALGAGLAVLVKPGVSFAVWFFPSALMGIAIGSEAALLTIIAGLAVPNMFIATATCISAAVGLLGGSLATTMYNQIYRSKLNTLLPEAIASAAGSAGVPESSIPLLIQAYASGDEASLASIPGTSSSTLSVITHASRTAYARSFSYIWYTLIAWCGVSVIVALMYHSTAAYMNDEVAAPIQSRRQRKSGVNGDV
ncbi:fungal trichothecene efflux pump [Aspergillus heterothallicus]